MENEKIFELMGKMYSEIQNGFKKVDQQFKQVNERFVSLENRFGSLESKVDNLETKVNNLETKVDKNTIILEKMQGDIKILAEVQQSFSDQLDRTKSKEGKTLGERLDIIELAVSNTSKSLTESHDKLSDKIDDLQIDVNTLTAKILKTDTKVIQFERLLSEKKQG